MKTLAAVLLALSGLFLAPVPADAQAPPPYGAAIPPEAEARKNNWNVVICVVDPGGHLVALSRLDNTQFGSIEVARQKAYGAVAYRRPTKVFQDAIAKGGENVRLLGLTGASLLEGGIPIIVDGHVVGAVGVSGVTSTQDAQTGQAGIDALRK
jgi:glc operon protein GlcG